MRQPKKSRSTIQLELFPEHPITPTWGQLPRDVQQRAHWLLARLLRSHRHARRDPACDRGVPDE